MLPIIGNRECQRPPKTDPAAPPVEVDNVHTDDQKQRLLDVVHAEGPWTLIIAQYFASADENNRGVVVQNEMMMHRGEANGPLDQQVPAGLGFDTMFTGDPADKSQWLLKNGDEVIARHHTDQLRFLVHWSAEVFTDYEELKKNMDGSDDLTIDKAIDMLVDYLHKQGIKLDIPSEPLHDADFVGALNAAYDVGTPTSYPEEAPVSAFQLTSTAKGHRR